MKKYNKYLALYNKMIETKAFFDEIRGKKPDDISDETMQKIYGMYNYGVYDEICNITDFHFIDGDDIFELFEEMNIADDVRGCLYEQNLSLVFCISFYFGRDVIDIAYYDDLEKSIKLYESALQRYKEWEDEDDNTELKTYNIMVIEESINNYRVDSESDEWVNCWDERETIRTNYFDKLLAKVVGIQENAMNDLYQTKIFIDLDKGEEAIAFVDDEVITEKTGRATFYLKRLGYTKD